MAAARRPPPIYVLNHDLLVGNSHAGEGGEGWADPNVNVGNGNLTGKAEEGWTNIEVARRAAFGCGDNMRRALNGLSLCVRLGDNPLVTSTLAIRISRDARDRFISELGVATHLEEEEDDGIPAVARIMMQQEDLLVIFLLFERSFRKLSYYLVYDRNVASLFMVSSVSDSLNVVAMFRPVPMRTIDGAYQLFHLACNERGDCWLPLASDMDPRPFLCVFSPEQMSSWVTGKNPACAWETRMTLRWDVPVSILERFRMDATFSFQGRGFWADLSQALIYCDLPPSSDAAVDFGFIELPGECQLNLKEMLDCPPQMKKVTRTIGCIGDSVCFVCIRRGKGHGDDVVTMWTLEMPWGQWKKKARFHVRDLWRFDGFKEAGLPKAKAGYPLITADGALCLVVTGRRFKYSYSDVSSEDYICTFDVHNKRLLWHGTVHDHSLTQTVAFPPDFFPMKHPSHKRKFDKLCSATGPGIAAMA